MEDPAAGDAISSLGQELKQWEKHFAACNSGKKPSRQDIKQDAVIAAKYKEYQALRDSQNVFARDSKKRKRSQQEDFEPHRNTKPAQTPQKRRNTQEPDHLIDNGNNCSPAPSLAFIGPTPQKNGHVLGLFDVLPGSVTPSKSANIPSQAPHTVLDPLDENAVISTPTKSLLATTTSLNAQPTEPNVPEISTPAIHHQRTPRSSQGKRFLLDKFVTPSKRRRGDQTQQQTPPSQRQVPPHSATPSFLRRHTASLPQIPENGNSPATQRQTVAPARPGAKRKGLTRSLSTMIAEMRAAEEARLDEEMELLREMEGEDEAEGTALPPALVQDSQPALPLGPDGDADEPEVPDETQKETAGRPWRKRGMKRQTRRVTMKPAAPKAASSMPATALDTTDVDEDASDDGAAHDGAGDSQVDELDHSASPSKRREAGKESHTAEGNAGGASNTVRKAARKISATAHANFRRLKIRSSKGAKAAVAAARGGKGRFGKGRR